ncbi:MULTISPECIES: precorrin-8X methylmutase [Corynebacterium]|uniref:precorrin-8X methylmutase n=1 Tax=Corynebacterium TaxID=1716 RepID=UPI0019582E07|nr:MULTISPECIES: precorrin-8X methylmutase [Corynebacterium]MDN8623405.1 precorrin-8X methylmutase [Corynebacterium kroppenstedtii]QRQ66106.1 precorrin-8X methylmutase [Corynebacterium kroppenstedtii]
MYSRDRYVSLGNDIYRRSFAIIRDESDLSRFSADEETVAVRMIHAAGDVSLADDIVFSDGAVRVGRAALEAGASIFTDVRMVSSGVTRRRLPADNDVECLLNTPGVAEKARELSTTRSAAAFDMCADRLGGAVVAVGNAPTALFHLMDVLAARPELMRPAVIIGIPVGFVGAAESKSELEERAESLGVEFITVRGRRGGSAITCAAINALARRNELMDESDTSMKDDAIKGEADYR